MNYNLNARIQGFLENLHGWPEDVMPTFSKGDLRELKNILNEAARVIADRESLSAEVLRLQAEREAAYDAGWIKSAKWADRVDLIADIGSAAFKRDKSAALSPATTANEVSGASLASATGSEVGK